MNADKALELARLAYPNDENLRVAYMLGLTAGAEWQKEQDNNFERFKDYTDKALISLEEAREQGRQEMKQQMMKEAKDGTMVNVGGSFGYDVLSAKLDNDHTITMCVPHKEGRKFGEKVRVLVLKAEEE